MLSFVQKVFAIGFEEEPDYGKLSQILRCILLEKNMVPDLKFDWSKFSSKFLRGKSAPKEALMKSGEENLKHDEREEYKK